MSGHRDLAQNKIKSYLANEFVPTEKKARYWFDVINKAVFDDIIIPSEIKIRGMKKSWGMCSIDGDFSLITINSEITTRKLFISTLSHEMVHLWQVQTGQNMNHASSYLEWKKYFKKHFKIIL